MSDAERHARASALFLELRALAGAQRAEALRAATAGDERLRHEVASLLAHDAPDEQDAPDDATELPGRIGPYRIVGRLGRGGSGQVLLGEQEEPVRRRVAVKVVPAAALSAELAARFEVERRALEATDHPHIARILDTGRTADGLPYLVMDLVEGLPITHYCRRHGLTLAERVELLLPVADALQHAHQRGVVHRDVKPANLLVSERDGRPFPTVLDFGIAKQVAGAVDEGSPQTMGLPLGTPSYMAPEQTGSGTVDVRADVYALGALLYELATGAPPIQGGGDALELLRRIREEVPPPASTRAADRRAAPRGMLADLDAIAARALEKDPERRYPTVDALAADLKRMLARTPIEARAPTLRYRAGRFLQRNRVAAAAALLVVLALVAGVVGLTTGLREARRQTALAEREELAQREINRFLTEDLLFAATPDELGAEVKAIDLLNRASERLSRRFPTRPLVAAVIHQTLANAYAELGDYDAAQRHVERALELRRLNAGAESPEAVRSEILAAELVLRRERFDEGRALLVPLIARARLILGPDDPDLYTALNDLGIALESLGELDGARAALEEALAARRRLLPSHHRDVLTAMGNLALVLERHGDVEGSIALLEQGLRDAEAAPEPQRFTLMALHNNLGATYQDLDRDQEAIPHLRRAQELANDALGPDHPGTATILVNLAGLEAELGDPLEAAALYERVVESRSAKLGPAAESTLIARYGYHEALRKSARRAETLAGFDALLGDVTAALGPNHWLTAQTMASLAYALAEEGREEEALEVALQAESAMRAAYGAGHPRLQAVAALIGRLRGG